MRILSDIIDHVSGLDTVEAVLSCGHLATERRATGAPYVRKDGLPRQKRCRACELIAKLTNVHSASASGPEDR